MSDTFKRKRPPMINTDTSTAAKRAAALLDSRRVPSTELNDGYLDTLGGDPPHVRTFAQRLMRTTLYATGYQLLRPIGFRILGGAITSSADAERSRISGLLGLQPGQTVLDIGCGPGNFTGWFGGVVGQDGLAVGVDASREMLRRAVADNAGTSAAYVRGDAENLPFSDAIADAVSCLAALYLINRPFQAIDEMARVLKTGGRIAILTSLAPGGVRTSRRSSAFERLSGITMFGLDDITDHLRDTGFGDIEQQTSGLAQTITAVKR